MTNKKVLPAYKIVRSLGQGSITNLAKTLNKSPANVSATLRKGSISFNNSFVYTDAINETFGTAYTRDELFLTQN